MQVHFNDHVYLKCIVQEFYSSHILPVNHNDKLESLLQEYKIHLEQTLRFRDEVRNTQTPDNRIILPLSEIDDNIAINGVLNDDIQMGHNHNSSPSENVEFKDVSNTIRMETHPDLWQRFYDLKLAQLAVQTYLDNMLLQLYNSSVSKNRTDAHGKCDALRTLTKLLDTLFAAERGLVVKGSEEQQEEDVSRVYIENVRVWIIYVSSFYLELSDVRERRYLLLQLLHNCSITWAIPLLQYTFGDTVIEKAFLEEYILALQLILDCDLQAETDENAARATWNEDDHLEILDQLAVVHVYSITANAAFGQLHFDADANKLAPLFNFSGRLLNIVNAGIRIFTAKGMNILTKRLAQTACQTLQVLSEKIVEEEREELCQDHIDEAISRVVYAYLDAKESNVWNFLPSLPYYASSIPTLWCITCNLLHLEQNTAFTPLDHLRNNLPDLTQCLDFLGHNQLQGTFMLNCLSNIAISLPADSSDAIPKSSGVCLLLVIAHTLFTVAFVDNDLREIYYKDARDHFEAICRKHPVVISFLLRWTSDHFSTMEGMALYLFHSLPLERWNITQDDLNVIRQLLCQGPSANVSTSFARYIIEHLNLEYDPKKDDLPSKWQPWNKRKCPFLPYEIHEELAFLLLDACQKYRSLRDTEKGADLVRAVASTMANYLPISEQDLPAPSVTAEFFDWTWSMMMRLKLYDCPISPRASEIEKSVTISILRDTLHNHPDTVASHGALLTYVLFLLSPTSRHFLRFEAGHGWMKLLLILRRGKPRAVIQTLSEIVPAFVYMHGDDFFNDETLSEFMRQMIYLKSDPHLINTVSKLKERIYWDKGQATGVSMIIGSHAWQGHFIDSVSSLMDASGRGFSYLDLMLHSWLKTVFRKSDWMWYKQYVVIVDCLCRVAFSFGRYNLVRSMLAEEQKKLVQRRDQHIPGLSTLYAFASDQQRNPLRFIKNILPDSAYTSLLTGEWSMLSLTTTNLFHVPGVEQTSLWFAYEVLMLETREEQEYRQSLAQYAAHRDPATDIDLAVHFKTFDPHQKKVPEFCCVYRWAQHILVSPPNHPLLPLYLQVFFCLYFSCFTLNNRTIFYGQLYFAKRQDLLNKLRDYIAQVQTYHGQCQVIDEKEHNSVDHGVDHEKLRQIYYAMWIWIGSAGFHSDLDISSLPDHYCTDLLKSCRLPSTDEQWEIRQPWNNVNAIWFGLVNRKYLQEAFLNTPWQGSLKFRNNTGSSPSISSETHRSITKTLVSPRVKPPAYSIRQQQDKPSLQDLVKLTEESLLAPLLDIQGNES
ncbi:Ectopic P granules protein 5 [Apophysomyces ossiformis]|uniref:Ectopic P granules protein 5 n=1 Tax=Apophysomyces ossiformis TaxID=679940 RepID=A0A8H7BGY2_9FUNG|nr:Ectopic P granules protein 5 [Apophysomyces ossiformis]